MKNNAGYINSSSDSTYTNSTKSMSATGMSLRSNSSSFRPFSSISTTSRKVGIGQLSNGSAISPLSRISNSLLSSTTTLTSSHGMISPEMGPILSSKSSSVRSSNVLYQTAPEGVSSAPKTSSLINQTSGFPTSVSSTKFGSTVVHSNTSLLGLQASRSTLLSSVLTSTNLASSTFAIQSLMSFSSITNNKVAASLDFIFTSTSSGDKTLTAIAQIAIPTTTMSPTDAAAIDGGVAIAGGLVLLLSQARPITNKAGLLAMRPRLINSIDDLKTDLKTLSLDLGGKGTPDCTRSESSLQSRKRSVLGHLLDTISKTICSLAKAVVLLTAVEISFAVLAAQWAEIETLAATLMGEEVEEKKEEEEEEEKESQSQSQERASETAKEETQSASTSKASISSTVSSSSVSHTPIPYYSGLMQPYPVDIDDVPAADEIVLAVAAFELSLAFGNRGSGSQVPVHNSTSSNTNSSIVEGSTASAASSFSILPASAAASISEASITSTFVTVASVSRAFISTGPVLVASISAAPAYRASVSEASISAAWVSASSAASASRASISAASAYRVSLSEASVSVASALAASSSAASALRASISAVSASAASVSRASISAASALAASSSAAAVTFPTQISSNNLGSNLCKSIGSAPCIYAYHLYNPLYLYTQYTSYVHVSDDTFSGKWLGWGCTAMFECDSKEAYAKGMMGQEILNAFEFLYSRDDVGVCGSLYMDNGCHLTVNACGSCEGRMPCEALPEQYQPPHGGVPCYYNDGTTWPPPLPPKGHGGPGLD